MDVGLWHDKDTIRRGGEKGRGRFGGVTEGRNLQPAGLWPSARVIGFEHVNPFMETPALPL